MMDLFAIAELFDENPPNATTVDFASVLAATFDPIDALENRALKASRGASERELEDMRAELFDRSWTADKKLAGRSMIFRTVIFTPDPLDTYFASTIIRWALDSGISEDRILDCLPAIGVRV